MLMRIPEYLIPLAVLLLGGAMLVIVILVHGFGLDLIVGRYKKKATRMREGHGHPRFAVFIFAGTIFRMLVLHLIEIGFWGTLLFTGGLVRNIHEAFYFSANAYTTLGMGSMALPHSWHELSPIIAIAGLFAFAWTTSEMFNIVGDQHDLVSDLRAQRHKKVRSAAKQPSPQLTTHD